jgi:fumarate hydratase class II
MIDEATYRTERDSLGEVKVPTDALWGAQTQRAVENFTFSPLRLGRPFIRALGLIKLAAAEANAELGLLDADLAAAISGAAREVADGLHDAHFPIDVFQTGSGTSTNMNANEVIANLANLRLGGELGAKSPVHPNDHVNICQSSNDVIPATIHTSAALGISEQLLPALDVLYTALTARATELRDVVKTGRTHLMDAMPVTLGQEIEGWAAQVEMARTRVAQCLPELQQLALGGTAVGTGVNAHPDFASKAAEALSRLTGLTFEETRYHFAWQSSLDTAVATSGALRALAVSLMKMANDLRWMNSGPTAGLAEIQLPALQPGSSIMPAKVNPVIPEAVMMACAQVMGNDVTIGIAGQAGNFELNTMMPLVAYDLLQSIGLMAEACAHLTDKVVAGFTADAQHMGALVNKNPILVTALAPVIGYDLAAEIGKRARSERRSVGEVAREMTDLSEVDIAGLLDVRRMARPHD